MLAALSRGLSVMAMVLFLAFAVLLGGCGGGDPEPDEATPPVQCQPRPELCK